MAHPETPEAVDAPATLSMADASAVFADDNEEIQPEADDVDPDDGDIELDEGEEPDGEDDEPETAIDAPASLNAAEKKAFEQLQPEAQQLIADVETRRNAQVQEATTRAAERERAAETAVAQAEAMADQRRAAQLKVFADHFRPQMPHPQLAYDDPASYIAAKANYDFEAAQFAEVEQQIEALQLSGQQQASEIETQQRVADLMTVPKLADPALRDEYVKTSLDLVNELGLDPVGFQHVAGSEDFKALEKIAEWKSKAERLDKAVSRQMQKVRAGKGKTLRPGAAQPSSGAERVSTQAMQAFRSNPSSRHAAAAVFEDI